MSVGKPPSFEEPCRIGAERRPFVCPRAGGHCLSTYIPAFLTPCLARNRRTGLLTGIRKKERFVRCYFVRSRSEYVLLSSSSGSLAALAFSQKAGRGSCRKCRDPTHLPPGRGRPSAAPPSPPQNSSIVADASHFCAARRLRP